MTLLLCCPSAPEPLATVAPASLQGTCNTQRSQPESRAPTDHSCGSLAQASQCSPQEARGQEAAERGLKRVGPDGGILTLTKCSFDFALFAFSLKIAAQRRMKADCERRAARCHRHICPCPCVECDAPRSPAAALGEPPQLVRFTPARRKSVTLFVQLSARR